MQEIPLRVNYKREFEFLASHIVPVMKDVISNGRFILGPDLSTFEEEFAKFLGVKRVVGVGSGTAALHLSLRALGVGFGDEVITTSMSFHATAEAIVMCGAKPVFADVLDDNLSMDHSELERLVSPRTKAVIVVHLYGIPAEMDAITRLCSERGIFLIEDCAQAHGAMYHERYVGTLGDIGCFSFMPAKNLGCYGEGGCIVTNQEYYADRVQSLRNHGSSTAYIHTENGFSERLDNIQAAVLNVKIRYLEAWNQRRNRIASKYAEGLDPQYLKHLGVPRGCVSSYYAYVIKINNRDRVAKILSVRGIKTAVFYPRPLHLQPALLYLGHRIGDLPIVERLAGKILAIPMFPFLADSEVQRVIDEVNEAVTFCDRP